MASNPVYTVRFVRATYTVGWFHLTNGTYRKLQFLIYVQLTLSPMYLYSHIHPLPVPTPLSYLSSITTCLLPPTPESIEGFMWRHRLSCGRMIRLLAHPFPSITRQQVVAFLCVPVKLISVLTREGGRGRVRSQIIRPRESLTLYISFYTLCPTPKKMEE
jgi:hypothetical protein